MPGEMPTDLVSRELGIKGDSDFPRKGEPGVPNPNQTKTKFETSAGDKLRQLGGTTSGFNPAEASGVTGKDAQAGFNRALRLFDQVVEQTGGNLTVNETMNRALGYLNQEPDLTLGEKLNGGHRFWQFLTNLVGGGK